MSLRAQLVHRTVQRHEYEDATLSTINIQEPYSPSSFPLYFLATSNRVPSGRRRGLCRLFAVVHATTPLRHKVFETM